MWLWLELKACLQTKCVYKPNKEWGFVFQKIQGHNTYASGSIVISVLKLVLLTTLPCA